MNKILKNGLFLLILITILIPSISAQECPKIYDEWKYNYSTDKGIIETRQVITGNLSDCTPEHRYKTICYPGFMIDKTLNSEAEGIHKCIKVPIEDPPSLTPYTPINALFEHFYIPLNTLTRPVQVRHTAEGFPYYFNMANKGYSVDTLNISYDSAKLMVGFNNEYPIYDVRDPFIYEEEFNILIQETKELDMNRDNITELSLTLNEINNDELNLTFTNLIEKRKTSVDRIIEFLITRPILISVLVLVMSYLILSSVITFNIIKKRKHLGIITKILSPIGIIIGFIGILFLVYLLIL